MRSALTTIAPLALLGLVPAYAAAAPARDSTGFVLAGDAGSAGSGSDHGHNNPNNYERQQNEQQQDNSPQLHVQVPGLPA